MPPVFKKKIHDLETKVGSAANFECEIEDAPNVIFKWLKSNSELRQSEKYRIISHHTTSRLELLNSTKEDGGVYTCCASNKHGTDSCSANLNITGKLIGLYNLNICLHSELNDKNWDSVVLNTGIKVNNSSRCGCSKAYTLYFLQQQSGCLVVIISAFIF